MHLAEALAIVSEALVAEKLDQFRGHIDPDWIEEALDATGTASVRRRRLPAEQVVWLVIGMGLLRNESIDRITAMLDLALPSADGGTAAKSGIAQARQRLGPEPLAHLFGATADRWADTSADSHRWRKLALYGFDGTTLRVPDSDANRDAFGGQIGNGVRAGSAYPTVRLVALMALRSHVIADACFGAYEHGESTLAADMFPAIPENSLTIVDRNYAFPSTLARLHDATRGRHFLTRARKDVRIQRVKSLGRNDSLVEVSISAKVRKTNPDLPERWVARAIRYQRKGFPASTLLTSLLDPEAYPAKELVGLYHERWEIELGYDEMKTHLLDREEAIRSRTPDGVEQEIWGILLAYNLVRVEMERAADEVGVPPTRVSFVNALSLIRYAFFSASTRPLAPGRIPKTLLEVRRNLKLLLLPERRDRSYPRAVKIKMSNYPKKQPRRRK